MPAIPPAPVNPRDIWNAGALADQVRVAGPFLVRLYYRKHFASLFGAKGTAVFYHVTNVDEPLQVQPAPELLVFDLRSLVENVVSVCTPVRF